MGSISGVKNAWLRLSIRTSLILTVTGLSIEALVVLQHFVISYLQAIQVRPFHLRYTTMYGMNGLVALAGALILAVGAIALFRALRVGRWSALWGYIAVFSFVMYRLLDAINSFSYLFFAELLGLPKFDLDVLIMNLFLVNCAIALFLAMLFALYDSFKKEKVLAERNRELSREIQERRLLTTAFENAAESILITDASGKILYVNPAFEELTAYTREEALGNTPGMLKSGHHDEAFYRDLWDTLKSGKVWRGHFMNKRKDGALISEDATISAIQDEEGVTTHYVAVKRDVTREKLLEQQVQQSQKLEAVGTLAGGIAHDLNNVLAVIIGHSEISMERLEPDHPVRKSMEVIMRTGHRSSQMIKRLLVFSRQEVAEAGPMDPVPLVREQMKIIRSYLPSNISISDAVDKNAGHILGEPIEIQQIIFNLCTNANHAMQPDGGNLKIGMDTVVLAEEKDVATGTLKPGAYVRLYVSDTGCGMEPAIQKRIFDPFFTTKEAGMGTGLGLSMVHGSILRSGGAIDLISAPGEGSRFELFWPKLLEEPVAKVQDLHIPDGEGRRVLVVDDMEDFRQLVEASLTVHGFKVRSFSNGGAALDFLRENPEAADIALVDYMMPSMNGSELAGRLHQISPDLPVVLMSGYNSAVNEENAAEYGFSAVLGKPVETAQLAQTLRRCARH